MRRKFSVVAVILSVLIFSSMPAFAVDGYFSVGTGMGGSAEEYNLTIEAGAMGVEIGDRKYLMGGGMPLIPHGYDKIPSDTYDYPAPHGNYTTLGEEYDGTELGLFGKTGIETMYPGFYFSALLGFTRVTEIQVSESNTTGRHYEQSSEKNVHWMYGIGATYFKELLDDDWRFCFQLDLDNRRGLTGSVGFYW